MTSPEDHSITIEFEDNALLPYLYGRHNSNLIEIEQALNVTVDSFGNIIQIKGDKDNATQAKSTIEALYQRIASDSGAARQMADSMVGDALRWVHGMGGGGDGKIDAPKNIMQNFTNPSSAIQTWRRSVVAKSAGQDTYLKALAGNPVVFGIGPAGTGKTYLAVAKAVEALKSKQVERIVLSRPAVEAGERLGFLPGDMKDKVDPYLRPLYDALYDMMPPEKVEKMLGSGQIEIAPIAFMRGRTLHHSYVIIDEAQNTTPVQMKMLLTRLGDNANMVITGDLTQIDLPAGQKSGLAEAVKILNTVDGVAIIRLAPQDVVRHPVVGRILAAYEEYSKK